MVSSCATMAASQKRGMSHLGQVLAPLAEPIELFGGKVLAGDRQHTGLYC